MGLSWVKSSQAKKIIISALFVIVAACCAVLGCSLYTGYENSVNDEAEMISNVNRQLCKAVDLKIAEFEKISNLLFTDDNFSQYDAAQVGEDSYESKQLEDEMGRQLESLSLLGNYSDFCVMYKNDKTIGIVCSATENLLDNQLYETADNLLEGKKTAWIVGQGGDYSRIYYIRKEGDFAIFLASFYAAQLSDLFLSDNQLGGAKCYILGENMDIAASTDSVQKIGLDSEYLADLDKSNCTIIDTDYIQCINTMSNGWKAVTVKDLSEKKNQLNKQIIVGLGIMIVACVLYLIIFVAAVSLESYSLSKSQDAVDSLTGFYNAEAAENLIADKIETCMAGSTIMLALISIKNYNLIFEDYGEDGCSEAVVILSDMLKQMYNENSVVARTQENEFAIFADFSEYDLFKAHDRLRENLKQLESRLDECQLPQGRGMIKCAIGAAIYPDVSQDYDMLYECAKTALNEAIKGEDLNCVLYKNK